MFQKQLKFTFIWIVVISASIGCSMIDRLPVLSEDNPTPLLTRTPLPTFTLTPETQAFVSVMPTPTSLPVLPTPTPTPVPPTPEPAPTEAAPTELPPPTNTPEPPPPPPTEAPPTEPSPTEPPPPPPPEPGVGANGVIGKLEFRDGRNTYAVGERVFVKIEATIAGGAGQKPFGILGLQTSTGAFQTSWSEATIDGKFTHEDGVAFEAPGDHKIWLAICFSSKAECQGPDGNWERFEPGLDVVIQ